MRISLVTCKHLIRMIKIESKVYMQQLQAKGKDKLHIKDSEMNTYNEIQHIASNKFTKTPIKHVIIQALTNTHPLWQVTLLHE